MLCRRILSLCILLGFGCGKTTTPGDGECESNTDCLAGWLCVDSACAMVCNVSAQCPGPGFRCEEGVCVEVSGPECTSSADCTNPGQCETDPAPCVGGACEYRPLSAAYPCEDSNPCSQSAACDGLGNCVGVPKTCDSPPDPECITDDTYRAYVAVGTCDRLTGGCSYEAVDIPCADCAIACLGTCDGVVCDAYNGGCQPGGVCIPNSGGQCQYDVQADGTACTLPGGGDGVCSTGQCNDCNLPADCTSTPGHPDCFDADCVNHVCSFTVRASDSCAPQSCASGTVSFARTCGPTGACPDTGGRDCAGYNCNVQGTDCLTTCATDADCVNGLHCDPGPAICQGFKPNGQDCVSDGECIFTCINNICSSVSTTGLPCDGTPDCIADHACSGGQCLKLAGGSCTNNGECVDACINSTCAPLSPTNGECDETADCAPNHTCAGTTCKRNLGEPCSVAGQCNSGFCADGICCATACGLCQVCDSGGQCTITPSDDPACGTIPCSDLDTACASYADLTGQRCASMGACKSANPANCTDVSYTTAECRPAAGPCDAAESCDGQGACPTNQFLPNTTQCQTASGVCDADDYCTGSGPDCPATYQPTNLECRAEAPGGCDVAETCTGTSATCPSDRFATGTCRAGTGVCNKAETCTGSSATCPSDGFSWTLGQSCVVGAIVGDLLAIANDRNNVTAADRTACLAHCDATVGARCCMVTGFDFCVKTCSPVVWCYAYDTPATEAYTGTGTSYASVCE